MSLLLYNAACMEKLNELATQNHAQRHELQVAASTSVRFSFSLVLFVTYAGAGKHLFEGLGRIVL